MWPRERAPDPGETLSVPPSFLSSLFFLFSLFSLSFLSACDPGMTDEGRIKPLEASSFFADGRSARTPPAGTVARGRLAADVAFETGLSDGTPVADVPLAVDRAALERGRERFGIFCAPCHGLAGYGDGMIVRRGYRTPPSFHSDRLRQAPAGHFFDVMTRGFGAMPDYAGLIPAADRWRIVAYLRALQLSQYGRLEDVPPDALERLEGNP
jgi:mono/diheme cytochrome c family protein